MKYKLDPEVVYSDTDSIFTTDKTPFENIISKDLGDFKDSSEFNEFGESKILMAWAVVNDPLTEFAYHQNVLIDNSTTFDAYWEQVGPLIK